jgi:hypothetical protein
VVSATHSRCLGTFTLFDDDDNDDDDDDDGRLYYEC